MNPKTPLSLRSLQALSHLEEAIFESLPGGIYRLLVKTDGHWYYVADDGRAHTAFNIAKLQCLLVGKPVSAVWLKQSSCFDEMVGQPAREQENTLMVRISIPEELL